MIPQFRTRPLLASSLAIAFFFGIVGCGSQESHTPAAGGPPQDSAHHAARPLENIPSASSHEALNADGIQPVVDSAGATLVGWDELVRNGSRYKGKRIHVKGLVGAAINVDRKQSIAYVFPVNMNVEMMQALMEFTAAQPATMGASMPVQCEFKSKGEAQHVKGGAVQVLEGTVKVNRTGPGTGFTLERGIQTATYVTLVNAHVIE